MKRNILLFACLVLLEACQTSATNTQSSTPLNTSTGIPSMPSSATSPILTSKATVSLDAIEKLAENSQRVKYNWNNRGHAPKGYVKGIGLVFAKSICNQTNSDVQVVSQANSGNDKDALSWYKAEFDKHKMNNDTSGLDTLRHAYTLLIGLGMQVCKLLRCRWTAFVAWCARSRVGNVFLLPTD